MSESASPATTETAILGGGCFWCLEAVFLMTDGVVAVKSGYCGGNTANPTYRQVCSGSTGHAEVVKVDFDPARLSYREVLEIFFAIHDPTTPNRQGNDVGTQYRSAIYTTSTAQHEVAQAMLAELARSGGWPNPVVTELRPAGTFWPAEEDHDDYYWSNLEQPYCRMVIAPKVAKFRQKFAARWRTD